MCTPSNYKHHFKMGFEIMRWGVGRGLTCPARPHPLRTPQPAPLAPGNLFGLCGPGHGVFSPHFPSFPNFPIMFPHFVVNGKRGAYPQNCVYSKCSE